MDGTIHSKNPFVGTRMVLVPSGKISFRWHKMDTDRFPTSVPRPLRSDGYGGEFLSPKLITFCAPDE